MSFRLNCSRSGGFGNPSAVVKAGGKVMDFATEETNSFLVEVSGWDSAEKFFVEHTVLRWNGDEIKEVGLRSAVRGGDLVFIRRLQLTDGTENFPVTCQVTKLMGKGTDNRTLVQVAQLRPRAPFRQTMGAGDEVVLQLT
jgi:hypothetical protein